MRAILVSRFGGPEVLELADLAEPVAGPGQVLVDVVAAGVNFADTSRIAGTYAPTPELPFVPGTEVVGRAGDGRRVLAATFGGGGFAERAAVAEAEAVPVPDGVSDAEALALLVQGLTAWHVLTSSARIQPGETVVVNAAAGGVGTLAVQLARHFGAGRVIAVAGSPSRRELALSLGADVTVDGDPDGYADRILEAAGGPVDIVLESVGGQVFRAGLDVLANFGRLVTFGNASREPRPLIDPGELSHRNAAVIGFWLRPALTVPNAFRPPLEAMFDLVTKGTLRPLTAASYPLTAAAEAFTDLLARRTTGKITLRP
ncbi:NADPH2:quinone reductase [Actinoplanes tereljensis]|uniref:NADPH:quinone reductase n=1 Tax=Paractinoplanes tereljensis TaxID=571912 RepID=A0A919NK03_9ACTN|nr:NADPH:quinone oxidoreductase family protein [Actinoplanes tereljensis]GIF20125.1 NADPH:quinone reductase [Actinoplanes tereljensis]